jgi:hypothetical protein
MTDGPATTAESDTRMRWPLVVHLLSLLVAAALLLVIGRDQWFWWDEWAFQVPNLPGILDPHVGHWSTAPFLITRALAAVFGLHTYTPYLVLVVLFHLGLAHLIWRAALRIGVRAPLATAIALLFALLGAGAENIMWGFQIGFIGGLAVGMIAVEIVDRATLSNRRIAAGVAVALLALTFAGTAIPLVVAFALVVLRRRGWRPALIAAGIPAVVYGVWYLVVARRSTGATIEVDSVTDALMRVPQFAANMFTAAYGAVIPATAAGAAALVLLVLWALRNSARALEARPATLRGPALPDALTGYALAAATVVFSIMTASTRINFGGAESLGRYVYTITALTLPLAALALDSLGHRRIVRTGTVALVALLTVFNLGKLVDTADFEAARENELHRVFSAALVIAAEEPDRYTLDRQPASDVAPDVTLAALIELDRQGVFDPIPFGAADTRKAIAGLDHIPGTP